MRSLLVKLQGADRRSIGRSNEVVSQVLAEPARFREVFAGLWAEDPLVRMRSADALEKITVRRPGLLKPYKRELIALAAGAHEQEVRWHLAQMLPRLDLSEAERRRLFRLLLAWLDDRSSIVRTFAMQALADLAKQSPALRPAARRHIAERTATGTAAMKARGRKLLGSL